MTVYCATTSQGKLREFRLAAEQYGAGRILVAPLPGLLTIPAPAETGLTFAENARLKSIAYSAHTDQYVFADDSGLVVDALDGEPGIHSARYAGPGATDLANNGKLLQRLGRSLNRRARFVCVVSLAHAGEEATHFTGEVEGEILHEPRGTAGFGYDPLFFYPPRHCSFAELSATDKLELSHRGQALRQLFETLRTLR